MTRMLKSLLVVGLVGIWPAVAPDAQEIIDLPHDEFRLTTGIPQVDAPDSWPMVFGQADGQLCVLHLEGYRLRAIHSNDGGLSFGPEVDVAGMPDSPDVFFYQAVLADDGRIYAALITADPGGHWGLQFLQSTDMGQSWTTPTTVVTEGTPGYGLAHSSPFRHLAIDAGIPGQVAVAYYSVPDGGIYITSSMDMGANWSQPIRLDNPPPPSFLPVYGFDVAIDRSDGTIHVAYCQYDGSSYEAVVWVTRSSDFGATYDSVQSLSDIVPAMNDAFNLDLAVARDGSVLLVTACHDVVGYFEEEVILVFRSTDSGVTYERVLEEVTVFMDPTYHTQPRVAVSRLTDTVLIVYPDWYKLAVIRSGDNGASFGSAQVFEDSIPDVWVQEDIAIAQTEDGSWAVAWADQRNLFNAPGRDLYVRISRDDALSWEPEVHANSINLSMASTNYSGHKLSLAPAGPNAFFAGFSDNRVDDRNYRIWGTRIPVVDPSSSTEIRVDSGQATVDAPWAGRPTVASDGSAWLYAAFPVQDAPGTRHWYVRSSNDGASTFSEPIQLPPALEGWPTTPRLSATQEGHVFLTYTMYVQSGTSYSSEIRFNRSRDHGQSWLDESVLVHAASYIPSDSLSLGVGPDGRILISWEETRTISLARSVDEGDHFDVTTFDLGADYSHDDPALCVTNDWVFLAWVVDNSWSADSGIFAVVSEDGGATFSDRVHLHAHSGCGPPAIVCNEYGEAITTWIKRYSPEQGLWTARFDGAAWQPRQQAALDAELGYRTPRIAYTTEDFAQILIVIADGLGPGDVFASLSTDGGATFPIDQQLDSAGMGADVSSGRPDIATDGQGNVWVSWESDFFGFYDSVILRRSVDGGATFGTAWRVNREHYPGNYPNRNSYPAPGSAALPGAGFFVWSGERESPFNHSLFNRDLLNNAPTAICHDVITSAGESCVADANVDDGSFDPDGDAITLNQSPPGPYPLGVTSVVLTVTDDKGASSSCASTVTVVDDTPPSLSVALDPEVLWPPNHRMVGVAAMVVPTDNCDAPSVALTSVVSNETDNGAGDGDTVDDIQDAEIGAADFEFRLRAERAGGGNGRIYTAVYTATDGSGNATPEAGFVIVPRDQSGGVEPIELVVDESSLGSVVAWNAVSGAQSYDVIRGNLNLIATTPTVIDLGSLTCIEDNSVDLNTGGSEDPEVPPAGEAFFYLVAYFDGTSSGYGTESASKPRAPGFGDCD